MLTHPWNKALSISRVGSFSYILLIDADNCAHYYNSSHSDIPTFHIPDIPCQVPIVLGLECDGLLPLHWRRHLPRNVRRAHRSDDDAAREVGNVWYVGRAVRLYVAALYCSFFVVSFSMMFYSLLTEACCVSRNCAYMDQQLVS